MHGMPASFSSHIVAWRRSNAIGVDSAVVQVTMTTIGMREGFMMMARFGWRSFFGKLIVLGMKEAVGKVNQYW